GQKIPKRLSPLHYWKARKYTSDKKNTDLSIRDVNVIIYWHFDNVTIKGKVDWNNISSRILKGLRTLRKDYEIEKIIGIGDKRGFSDEQWDAFEKDPKMEMVHIPNVDRRKVLGQSQYADRIDYELENIAPANVNPPYFFPTQHLTEYQKQITGNLATPASESVGTVDIRKTDLAEVRLLQVLYGDVVDYGPPKILMLISSDAEFATPLLELKNKGFSILLADNDESGNDTTPLRRSTHAGWVFGELLDGGSCRYCHEVGQGSKDC
ncbi:unnamed protein product, partial [Brassica rapa subsp. trilocularis]